MHASEKGDADYLRLHVHGPAGLSGRQGRLRFRRKSLAILYWLAYEGPTRRERLADLLWDTADPLANLRVELSAINVRLREAGLPGLPEHEDPLVLPEGVMLDDHAVIGQPLEGLDGLGPDFQEWLDWRRTRLRGGAAQTGDFAHLLDSLGALRPPHLIVVETLPFSDAGEFAEALARRLRLPFSMHGSSPVGVRLTAVPYPGDAVAAILGDHASIHVFERPFFGPDPLELLELRVRMRTADITYLKLEELSWLAAREGCLAGKDFSTAADVYLKSGGHPGCLAEILDMPEALQEAVPRRYLAALELNLRRLPPDCRRALEHLVVTWDLPATRNLLLGRFEDEIEELARQRWLSHTRRSWEFSSMFAARLLCRSLLPGTFRAACRHVATMLEEAGDPAAAALLLGKLEETPAQVPGTEAAPSGTPVDGRKTRVLSAAGELFHEEPKTFGPHVEQGQGRTVFVRPGSDGQSSGVVLPLSGADELLRLSGSRYVRTADREYPSIPALPLSLIVDGIPRAALGSAGASGAQGGQLFLPLPESFDYWFLLPRARDLVVEAQDPCGLMELSFGFYGLDNKGVEREVWALDA